MSVELDRGLVGVDVVPEGAEVVAGRAEVEKLEKLKGWRSWRSWRSWNG